MKQISFSKLKIYGFLLAILVVNNCAAKSCVEPHRSCLELQNHSNQSVKIDCNSSYRIQASANSQESTQLDLSYGDGLGAPEPMHFHCQLSLASEEPAQSFRFYNPFWGSAIVFNLISRKRLEVLITDGWSSRQMRYLVDLELTA